VARWMQAHSDSARRTAFLGEMRAAEPPPDVLAPELLEDLARLQGAVPLPDGRIAFEEVQRLTALYERFFHPGAAFDRSVLHEVWRRCRDRRSGVACSEARREVERRIGSLGGEADAALRRREAGRRAGAAVGRSPG